MTAQTAFFEPTDLLRGIDSFSLNKRVTCAVIIFLADVIALAAGLSLSDLYFSRVASASYLLQHQVFIALGTLQAITFLTLGHYFKRLPYWSEYSHLLIFFIIGAITHALIGVWFREPITPWVGAWATILVLAPITRIAFRKLLRQADIWNIPTIIIGDGPNAIECAKTLFRERYLGYEVICFLSVECATKNPISINGKEIPVRAINPKMDTLLRRLGSPCIIIAVEKKSVTCLAKYADKIGLNYPALIVSPHLKSLTAPQANAQQLLIHELLMLEIKGNLNHLASRCAKRSFDLFGAVTLITVLSPLLLIVCFLVRKSGTQIIFQHTRIGRGGTEFGCLKFRSMVPNAQTVLEDLLASDEKARAEWEREFKLREDPRVTKIGNFLRQTSLDELPQLWNVIKGEMSLVGPRPVVREEIARYGKNAAFYYQAKPGITGLWQVSGRNDIDYDSRIDLDVWYVENWSMWKDIIILFRTVNAVAARNGAY